MAEPTDVLAQGLARDIALKRANEASAPAGPLLALMAMDRFTGAFRALRTGREGSLAVAPGPDWGQDLGDRLLLLDQAALPTITDSPNFDTTGWTYGLLTVQCTYSGDVQSRLPFIEVWAQTSALTRQLIYTGPILANAEIFQIVFPANHSTHSVRVTAPTAQAVAALKVEAERLPPGFDLHRPSITYIIAVPANLNSTVTILTQLLDPLAIGYSVGVSISGINTPSVAMARIEARPLFGQALIPFWQLSLPRITGGQQVGRIPNYAPMQVRWMQTAAGPQFTGAIDLTPIRRG